MIRCCAVCIVFVLIKCISCLQLEVCFLPRHSAILILHCSTLFPLIPKSPVPQATRATQIPNVPTNVGSKHYGLTMMIPSRSLRSYSILLAQPLLTMSFLYHRFTSTVYRAFNTEAFALCLNTWIPWPQCCSRLRSLWIIKMALSCSIKNEKIMAHDLSLHHCHGHEFKIT